MIILGIINFDIDRHCRSYDLIIFICIFFWGLFSGFQYSLSNNVAEVTREDFNACNTTNVLRSNSNGNTTFALTKPGQRLFVSGNRMYCLGGMKLEVNVEGNQTLAPAAAPQAGGAAALFPPSSKSYNPSAVVPGSSNHVQVDLLMAALGILGLMGNVVLGIL